MYYSLRNNEKKENKLMNFDNSDSDNKVLFILLRNDHKLFCRCTKYK